MRNHRRRVEVATSGVDEVFQGFSSDPLSYAYPQGTGLRIPPVLPSYTTPAAQPRYLFCLATRTISSRVRLLGLRQYVTLGLDTRLGTPPERPIEMAVQTPTWHFPDGNISWHLVSEPVGRRPTTMPSTDAAGWQFQQTDGSAMLYQDFTNTAVDPSTGAPLYYFQGLTHYDPPQIFQSWQALCGLGTMHDLRFSWYGSQWGSIDHVIEAQTRISLYASVLQTNPATRLGITPPSPWSNAGGTPEEAFVSDWTQTGEGPTTGPIYWRIAGSLIFEDAGTDEVTPRVAPLPLAQSDLPPGESST